MGGGKGSNQTKKIKYFSRNLKCVRAGPKFRIFNQSKTLTQTIVNNQANRTSTFI